MESLTQHKVIFDKIPSNMTFCCEVLIGLPERAFDTFTYKYKHSINQGSL